MTQACADCLTDNRDGAKFCKGCGKRLDSLTPVHSTPPAPSPRRPVAAPAAASLRRVERAKTRNAPRSTAAERPSPWRSAVIGLLIVAGPIAVAAWFFSEPPRPAIPPAPALATSAPAPSAPVLVEPVAPLATAPQDEPSAPDPAPAPAPAPMPMPMPMPMPSARPEPAMAPPAAPMKPAPAPPKSRKPAPPPAPVAALPAPAPAEPVPPPPAAPPNPQSQCAGLNFFARAQCLAAQCAKPELQSNAQCEAVRRQQQIEEERRNPTLLN